MITDRSTTRIHHAPGGKSSINLFGGADEPAQAPARRGAPASAAAPSGARVGASSAEMESRAQGAAVGFGARSTHSSSNAYASGSNQNTGNVITDRPTTRVHHAPGGKSSINIFSWGE